MKTAQNIAPENIVLCDVHMNDRDMIVIQDRGNPYRRFYWQDDLSEGERFVAEGSSYLHIYFCDHTVPAHIVEILENK